MRPHLSGQVPAFIVSTETICKRQCTMSQRPALDFAHFLPYRLSVASNTISQAIAADYEARFGLSVTQWRVMAILGRHDDLAAREVAERTAMDKVAVSRALAALIERGLVRRGTAREDRRASRLRLTAAGRRVHDQIVPLAIEHQRRLLARLSEEEQRWLVRILDALAPSPEPAEG